MTTSVGNSKVYQFLARTQRNGQAWQKQADTNKDGIVSHTEFEKFIDANFYNLMGEHLEENDMNIFWRSVDTDRLEIKRNVSGLNNLDAKEIDAMGKEMEDFVKFDEICRDAEARAKAVCIFNTPGAEGKWRAIFTAELTKDFETWRTQSRKGSDFYTYMTTNNSNRLAQIEATATAQVEADNVIQDWLSKPGHYWDDLAKLDPPYNILEDPEIINTINKLVAKYVNARTNVSIEDLPDILKTIKGEVSGAIEDYLATKGLDKSGKPMPVPETDENGDVKKDENGNYTVTDVLKPEQIQSFTVRLHKMLEGNDFISSIPSDHKGFEQAYIEAGKKYINSLIESWKKDPSISNSYSAFEAKVKEVENAGAAGIITAIQQDNELSKQIENEIAWKKLTDKLTEWFNKDFSNTIMNDIPASLQDAVKASGLFNSIQKTVLSDIKGYLGITELKENEIESALNNAKSQILADAKTQIADYLANTYQNGYNAAGLKDETREDNRYDTYNALATLLETFTTDETKRNEQYAKIALGYFKDVTNIGTEYAKIVIEVVGRGVNSLTVNDLAAEGRIEIAKLVNDVHAKVIKKINTPEEPEADETPENEEVNIDDNKVLFEGKSLKELLNGKHGGLKLCDFEWTSLENTKSTAIMNIKTYIRNLGKAITDVYPKYKDVVNYTIETVSDLYSRAIKEIYDPTSGNNGKWENQNIQMKHSIAYKDINGNVQTINNGSFGYYCGRSEDDIDITDGGGMLNENSLLGLRLEEVTNGWSDNSYTIGVNINTLTNVFMKILRGQAL